MDPLEGLRRVDPGANKKKGEFAGMQFSRTEIMHILVAVLVLAAAFTIMLRKSYLPFISSYLNTSVLVSILVLFAVALLLVVCSFLLHEMGHKFVAQKYGAWSEFRTYPMGLLMALVFSFMGFLFAAPGAVYINGNITKEQYGKISLAGPVVNFIIAGIAIVMMLMAPSGFARAILFMLAWLNAFLGVFNLIPIPPLDGSKVVTWSLPVYLVTFVIGLAELAFLYLF